ncbi:MAG: hypothetical protein K2N27_10930 [Ruminococcus sp.]|nr:hypothetical protein [Ruminococcus sp.]
MEELYIEKEVTKAIESSVLKVLAGFAAGFVVGASVMAIIDYHESKKNKLRRIQSGTDENYITSE